MEKHTYRCVNCEYEFERTRLASGALTRRKYCTPCHREFRLRHNKAITKNRRKPRRIVYDPDTQRSRPCASCKRSHSRLRPKTTKEGKRLFKSYCAACEAQLKKDSEARSKQAVARAKGLPERLLKANFVVLKAYEFLRDNHHTDSSITKLLRNHLRDNGYKEEL